MKYVHIMPHGNAEHNGSVINLINDTDNQFNHEEHMFVILKENVYNSFANYDNTVFWNGSTVDALNEYENKCDYIFLHSLSLGFKDYIKLKKNTVRKIIWIVWSFDLYMNEIKVHSVKDILRKCRQKAYFLQKKHYVRMFNGIGIGFKYDAFEIIRRYGADVNIYKLPYGYVKHNMKRLEQAVNMQGGSADDNDENKPVRIMIGHSAYRFLNHMEIMDKLKKFKDENILISLVLSYGDKEYAEEVKAKAKREWGDKAEIIDTYMNQEQYIKYLNSVDIAVIDYPHQIALGNIHKLMFLGKKIFLSKDGFLKKVYMLEGIKTFNVSDIPHMSFMEFIDKSSIGEWQKTYGHNIVDEKTKIEGWKNTLQELERI